MTKSAYQTCISNGRESLLLTYLRVAGRDQNRVNQLGSDLNLLVPGFFRGLSLDAQMIYWFCEVLADTENWDEHVCKLEALLRDGMDLLLAAVREGVAIEVRSVITSESYEQANPTRLGLPAMLLRRLTELEAPFLFRVYNS